MVSDLYVAYGLYMASGLYVAYGLYMPGIPAPSTKAHPVRLAAVGDAGRRQCL
jgi:hypothetical protein